MGELNAAHAAALAAHVAACPACAAAAEEEAALRGLCGEALAYRGPTYSFAQLQRRMRAIEPLQEVLVLLPKLQKIGATPRFAIAMALLVWFGGFIYATRNAKGLYAACKDPVMEQRFQIGRQLPDVYKTLYVKPVKEMGRKA